MIHYLIGKSTCYSARFLLFLGAAFFMFSTLFSTGVAAENIGFRLALAKTLESRETALSSYPVF